MGFRDLFRKESKEILCLPDGKQDAFIQPITKGFVEIKIGQKLKVEKGFWAVIVLKDKPLDVFDEGEWDLTLPNLPLCNKVLKLDKSRVIKKRGKKQLVFLDKFKCDLYFINKNAFVGQPWQTKLVYKKIKGEKYFTALFSGVCDFSCVDPKATIKLYLLETAKIGEGKAIVRLRKYLNEFATEGLEWLSYQNYLDVADINKATQSLFVRVDKNLGKYGIKIENFVIKKREFSKEVEEKILEFSPKGELDSEKVAEQNVEEASNLVVEDEEKIENSNLTADQIFAEPTLKVKEDESVEIEKVKIVKVEEKES